MMTSEDVHSRAVGGYSLSRQPVDMSSYQGSQDSCNQAEAPYLEYLKEQHASLSQRQFLLEQHILQQRQLTESVLRAITSQSDVSQAKEQLQASLKGTEVLIDGLKSLDISKESDIFGDQLRASTSQGSAPLFSNDETRPQSMPSRQGLANFPTHLSAKKKNHENESSRCYYQSASTLRAPSRSDSVGSIGPVDAYGAISFPDKPNEYYNFHENGKHSSFAGAAVEQRQPSNGFFMPSSLRNPKNSFLEDTDSNGFRNCPGSFLLDNQETGFSNASPMTNGLYTGFDIISSLKSNSRSPFPISLIDFSAQNGRAFIPFKFNPVPPLGYMCKLCLVPGHWLKNCSLYKERKQANIQNALANFGNFNAMPGNFETQFEAYCRPPPFGYVCRKCNVSGHWIQQCPQPKFSCPPESYLCKICHVKGHWIHLCPRRRSSHDQAYLLNHFEFQDAEEIL